MVLRPRRVPGREATRKRNEERRRVVHAGHIQYSTVLVQVMVTGREWERVMGLEFQNAGFEEIADTNPLILYKKC
jgi:hypothetical protein